jgi:ADP-heptose:LPS heptosyltransferase
MLSQWLPIAQQANVELVNLQYGDCGSELQEAAEQGVRVHNFPEIDPLVDMDGLAALVRSLDLVISVDNSTIHLAGALGVPTLAMVSFPSMAYWRWFSDGRDTLWYRSLELFRRNGPEGWSSMFADVAERLKQLG